MPISDSEVRSAAATNKRQYIACGNAMYPIGPISKGGRKAFTGRICFSPGRRGKKVDYCIAPYG